MTSHDFRKLRICFHRLEYEVRQIRKLPEREDREMCATCPGNQHIAYQRQCPFYQPAGEKIKLLVDIEEQ